MRAPWAQSGQSLHGWEQVVTNKITKIVNPSNVNFGYDPSKIKGTPQDCEVMSNSKLAAMMSMSGMLQALTNQLPDLG